MLVLPMFFVACSFFFPSDLAALELRSALYLAQVNAGESEEKIKEAEYLYSIRRFEEAKTLAQWVLNMDPQNQKAQKILGMIDYQEADYAQAYPLLKSARASDQAAREALAVSAILIGEEKEGQRLLDALMREGPVTNESYLRLGYGLLLEDKPDEAIGWFEKAGSKEPLAIAGKCFAAYEMQSWEEAVSLFGKIPAPYNALDGFQGIAIESYLALGDAQKAEELVGSLLSKPLEPDDSQYPSYFRQFKRKKLDNWNRFFVTAMFYKIVKKDNTKALENFAKIKQPTPLSEIEKAEVLIDTGSSATAKTVLLNLLKIIQGSEQENAVKMRLLPLLGRIYVGMGYNADALQPFANYLKLNSADAAVRKQYAQALMAVRRYDLALEQYRMLMKGEELLPEDRIGYIASLIHTNQFETGKHEAWAWLAEKKVPLLYQIELARLMVIPRYKDLIDSVFVVINENEKRSIKDNRQLILLWIDLGNYESASSLAGVLWRELESDADGLMVLAELSARLSKNDEALDFAQRAAELSPTNLRVVEFFENYDRLPDVIARSAKLLKENLSEDPENLTLELRYAKDLIDLAIESLSSGAVKKLEESPDIKMAQDILEKIAGGPTELPVAYFLLGKLDYLLDQDDKALENYHKALRLDPSYVEVYQYQALLAEDKGDHSQAIDLVQSAARFAPTDAKVWEQLGSLYMSIGKFSEANAAFKNAVIYTPNAPSPYIHMAEAYLKTQQPRLAETQLDHAMDLEPRNVDAIALMIKALYDPLYQPNEKEKFGIEKKRTLFFDKLQALAPEQAAKMRKELGIKEQS